MFMQEIRTNNDSEGWHTKLHKLAGLNQSSMNMYSLIELLHHDARSLDLNLKFVFQHRTLRRQRVGSRLVNSKICDLWVSYNDNEMRISTMVLV
jgi:hypothetical protein